MTSEFMPLALELARRGVGRTSPNPAVGAVIVRDGEIVGQGFHTWAGVKHAEIVALDQAGEKSNGATAYITLEPCSHQGRTPPCADALIKAGIKRVVAAMQDPNPQVSGQGFQKLREAGIEVEQAPEYQQAAEQFNEAFIHAMRTGRPLVTLKAAMTLDGKIAKRRGEQTWITSEEARAHVQTLRHHSDAILTGIGTVLADDPLLTDRTNQERSRPFLRIVLDRNNRLAPNSKLRQTANDDLLIVNQTDGFHEALAYLTKHKYRSLLIEAGAAVNTSALNAGIVDKLILYYAPKILGAQNALPLTEGLTSPVNLERVTLHRITGQEFALEGYVHRNH